MRPQSHIGARLLIVLAASLCRAEILDRVAVTVGKHVITESDINLELQIEAVLDQKPTDFGGDQKRKAADRLVDQYLILQEATASHLPPTPMSDAQPLIDQVKSQYGNEAAYQAALARNHVTEQELADHMLAGLRTSRFTDLRFRPEVQISEEDLRESYNTREAEWRRAKAPQVPSFEAIRDQLEKVLIEERVMQALDRWLGTVRSETQILYRERVFR